MSITKTSGHIQIKIKIQNPSQELPASSKVPNQDFKDNDHFQIEIKMPNSIEEPTVCSKSPYQDLKYMDVLCNSKIKIESQYWTMVYQRPVTISKSLSLETSQPVPSESPVLQLFWA